MRYEWWRYAHSVEAEKQEQSNLKSNRVDWMWLDGIQFILWYKSTNHIDIIRMKQKFINSYRVYTVNQE